MADTPEQPGTDENPADIDIESMDREQLQNLEDQLLKRFEELQNSEQTAEVDAEMADIAAKLPQIGDRLESMDQSEAQRASAVSAFEQAQQRKAAADQRAAEARQQREQAHQAQQTPDEADVPAEAPPTSQAPAAAPASDAAAQQAPGTGQTFELTTNTSGPATVTVAASAQQGEHVPSVADLAANAPAPVAPTGGTKEKWYRTLTAGAEISGMSAGASFESGKQIADALVRRTEAIAVPEGERSAMVARAHLESLGNPITQGESSQTVTSRMLDAVKSYTEQRERRDTLTASGGWCAPSETIYDLCEPEVADQLVSLPEIPITRGGIQFFPSPDMSDFDPFLFGFCEDELEKGVEKPCPEIPCPDPIEERACVEGACIKAGILMAKAFPEWVERYVRGILVAHAVRISAVTLARMEAGSTPVIYGQSELEGSGITASLLNAIEAQIEDLRADYFLGLSENMVVILPRWIRGAIRADLANRTGVDLLQVNDQVIDNLIRSRGVSTIQWVKGWQTDHIGAPGAQKAYPETVRFLVYREGSWVRGLEPVIEIDTMYDSQLIKHNKFTRLFTEQGILVANLCMNSRIVTVPVCPSGATHCGNPITCFNEITGGDDGSGEGDDGSTPDPGEGEGENP